MEQAGTLFSAQYFSTAQFYGALFLPEKVRRI